jgi:phosphatidate cytidylyltransferase
LELKGCDVLKQRVITAFFLLLVSLIAILFFPVTWFQLSFLVVLCLGAWEWSQLAGLQHRAVRLAYTAWFVPILYLLLHVSSQVSKVLLSVSVVGWLFALAFICLYPRNSQIWKNLLVLLATGFWLLLPCWVAMLLLLQQADFVQYILLLLSLVAAADIGAFFAGRHFGKHKLAPQVSPNKTWEGFAGGILASCAVVWTGTSLLPLNIIDLPMPLIMIGTVLLASVSVVGDLFESMLKRWANVKDSGSLLPGHGGVLDRIDSITAALPFYVWLLLQAGLVRW